MRPSQDEVTPRRRPTKKPGSEPGATTLRMNCQRPRSSSLGELHVLAVDAGQRGVRVDVHVHRDAERDDRDLHLFADAEPEDQQREHGQGRDRPLDLERAVQEVLAAAAQSGRHGKDHAGRHSEEQAESGALEGDQDVVLEPPGGDQVARGGEHGAGRGQDAGVEIAGRGGGPPCGDEQHRPDQPPEGQSPAGAEPSTGVSGRGCRCRLRDRRWNLGDVRPGLARLGQQICHDPSRYSAATASAASPSNRRSNSSEAFSSGTKPPSASRSAVSCSQAMASSQLGGK